MGCKWWGVGVGFEFLHLDKRYLYVDKNKYITWSNSEKTYAKPDYKECTLEDLLKQNTKEKMYTIEQCENEIAKWQERLEACKNKPLEKGWYKRSDKGFEKWLMYFDGKEFKFGFTSKGEWHGLEVYYKCNGAEYLATDEEVKERLLQEATKRGFVEGARYIYPSNKDMKPRTIEGGFKFHIGIPSNIIISNNTRGILDNKGEWAEVVEVEYQWLVKFKGYDAYQVTRRYYTSTQDVMKNAGAVEVVRRIKETERVSK